MYPGTSWGPSCTRELPQHAGQLRRVLGRLQWCVHASHTRPIPHKTRSYARCGLLSLHPMSRSRNSSPTAMPGWARAVSTSCPRPRAAGHAGCWAWWEIWAGGLGGGTASCGLPAAAAGCGCHGELRSCGPGCSMGPDYRPCACDRCSAVSSAMRQCSERGSG